MSICPHCGKAHAAPRENVPWWKYDPGGPTVGLGCGTVLLIGIVAAIFSRGGLNDLEQQVRDLNKEVQAMSDAID